MQNDKNILNLASKFLEEHFTRTYKPSLYIDAFRTTKGLELAIERNRKSLCVWTEPLDGYIADLGISPTRVYTPDEGRNSNLNQVRAPRLKKGRSAWYWKLENVDQFKSLIKLYETLGPKSLATAA